MPIYAGLDVGDKATHVCVVDVEGAVFWREVMASDPAILAKWFGRYCPSDVDARIRDPTRALAFRRDLSRTTYRRMEPMTFPRSTQISPGLIGE